jgi:hypothetical protein
MQSPAPLVLLNLTERLGDFQRRERVTSHHCDHFLNRFNHKQPFFPRQRLREKRIAAFTISQRGRCAAAGEAGIKDVLPNLRIEQHTLLPQGDLSSLQTFSDSSIQTEKWVKTLFHLSYRAFLLYYFWSSED